MREEIRPAIKTERWHIIPSTHKYPTRYKALLIQAIIMSEITKRIEKNHGRVYNLSDRATQQNINAILNPVTGNMMWYRNSIVDPAMVFFYSFCYFTHYDSLY